MKLLYLIGTLAGIFQATSAVNYIVPTRADCRKQLNNYVAIVDDQITRPIQFCQTWLTQDRTRSPLKIVGPKALSRSCVCILRNFDRPIPKPRRPGPLAWPPAKCNLYSAQKIKDGFKDPVSFCTFVAAAGKRESFQTGLTPAVVHQGCKCILDGITSTSSVTPYTYASSTSTASRSATTTPGSTTVDTPVQTSSSTSTTGTPSTTATIASSTSGSSTASVSTSTTTTTTLSSSSTSSSSSSTTSSASTTPLTTTFTSTTTPGTTSTTSSTSTSTT